MLGLIVTSFVETEDYNEADAHRARAEKMDLMDIIPALGVQSVAPLASRSDTAPMDLDTDIEVGPTNTPRAQTPPDNVVRDPLTGLYILGVGQSLDTPLGTPTSRVGMPSTQPHWAPGPSHGGDGAGPSRAEDCSASSGEEETPPARIPQLPAIDVLDMRARPTLDMYRENRRRRNKVPYVEFGINDVVVISDEDEEEIKMYDMVRGVPEGPVAVKKEAMTVAELDEKMARRMDDEIAQRISQNNQEHALKMAAIQLELERQRRESQEMHAQLMGFFSQLTARPQVFYATPPEGPHVPAVAMPPPALHSHYPSAPQSVQGPSLLPVAETQEDELRTRVRNSAAHPPSSFSEPIPVSSSLEDDTTSFTIVRRGVERTGHDTVRHTDPVEESQESPTPSGQRDVQMEDMQVSPIDNMRLDVDTEATHEEHVDTQASRAASTGMEMETDVSIEVTDARPHVSHGSDEGGSGSKSPLHAEVTNLA